MQRKVDASAIGNTPYVINQDNNDYCPLLRKVDFSAPMPNTHRSRAWLVYFANDRSYYSASAVFVGVGLVVNLGNTSLEPESV